MPRIPIDMLQGVIPAGIRPGSMIRLEHEPAGWGGTTVESPAITEVTNVWKQRLGTVDHGTNPLLKWAAIGIAGFIVYKVVTKKKRKNPCKSRKRRNPRRAPSRSAVNKYRSIQWGKEPDKVFEVPRRSGDMIYGDMAQLGHVTQINYLARKNEGPNTIQAEYYHKFKRPYPRLAVDERDRLHLVGGGYTVTSHGIER